MRLELVLLVQRLMLKVFIFHILDMLAIFNFLQYVVCNLQRDELILSDRVWYTLMVLRTFKLEFSREIGFILFQHFLCNVNIYGHFQSCFIIWIYLSGFFIILQIK